MIKEKKALVITRIERKSPNEKPLISSPGPSLVLLQSVAHALNNLIKKIIFCIKCQTFINLINIKDLKKKKIIASGDDMIKLPTL